MFEHLVESTSHKDDLARKGSFVLGTIAVYAVLLTAFFVLGIYLYDAQLENQSLELTTLVVPVVVVAEKPAEAAKQQKVTTDEQVDVREKIIQNVNESPIPPKEISDKASDIPPRRLNVTTVLGEGNRDTSYTGGPIGPGIGPGGGGTGAVTGPVMDAPPPPAAPKKPAATVSGGVLNGKAISLPKPPYPAIAKTARASGTVQVQVTIDENGNVVSASAVSGPPLLRAAAVSAARQARFSPTKLSGQPVKVTGVINYNFAIQ